MDAPATCPVHGVALGRRRVRLAYGLPGFPPGYDDAMRSRFPFGGEAPLGGCCVPETPETAVVEVCTRCAEARRTWWREQRTG